MKTHIRLIALPVVIAFAAPIFANEDPRPNPSMLEGLQDLAMIADEDGLGAFYDHAPTAGRPAASPASSSFGAPLQAQRLKASVVPVALVKNEGNGFERGFFTVMSPAVQVSNTSRLPDYYYGSRKNPMFKVLGVVVGAVLLAPAVIFGLVNSVFKLI